MNRTEASEISGSYRDVAKYIQEVITYDPSDLYMELDKPQPSKLPSMVRLSLDEKISQDIPRKAKVNEKIIYSPGVLGGGIADTQDFLHDALQRYYKRITPENAALISQAPSTVHVLAGLSLQAGGMDIEKTDFTPSYNKRFGINEAFTAIEIDGIFVTEKDRGCPHAGKNGEIRPTPLFKEFGAWCGALAVHSYFNYFHDIDATDAVRNARK